MKRVLVLLVVLAFAGCGGDEAADESAATPEVEPTKSIEIIATDFKLDPSTIQLPEAGTYEFVLSNEGQMQHALEIDGGDVEEQTIAIDPGNTAKVTVDLAQGDYEIYCPVGDHRERGMEGELVVGAGGGGTTTGDTETEDDDGYGY